jgi:hypothetical protein
MGVAGWAEETPDSTNWGFVGYMTCNEKDRPAVKKALLKLARKSLEESAEDDPNQDPENARDGAVIEWVQEKEGQNVDVKKYDDVVKYQPPVCLGLDSMLTLTDIIWITTT